MNRLHISLRRRAAITVDRVTKGNFKLAYVIRANKKLRYETGRSCIAYIGTTKNGIDRMAQSAASQSDSVFKLRGVSNFTVHVVTCTPRNRVKSWHKLERALLLLFREKFGEIPKCNGHGKKMKWRGEDKLFAKDRLLTVIEDLS